MASNRRILTKLAGELQATRTGMGSQLHGVYRGYTYVVKPGTGSGKKMMMVAFSVSNDQTPASVDVWGTMRARYFRAAAGSYRKDLVLRYMFRFVVAQKRTCN